jgi:hypothetical protein
MDNTFGSQLLPDLLMDGNVQCELVLPQDNPAEYVSIASLHGLLQY